jgi:glycosyltransferase involved in cell wall biosynthesis
VENAGIATRVFVIENTPEADLLYSRSSDSRVEEIRKRFDAKSLVLYAGTFEPYQGLDLLIESVPVVVREHPDVLFLLIGGETNTVEHYRRRSEQLGIGRNVQMMEKIPVEEVADYLGIADVLVSPRKSGTNTPLKIYSYLRSGKPIVATNLVTHTQVLNSEIAILTDTTPEAFAQGILEALENPQVSLMTERARRVAEEKYSYDEYVARISRLYAYVGSLRKPHQYLKNNASETAF